MTMIEKNCKYKDLYKNCVVEIIFVNDYPTEQIYVENEERYFSVKVINQPNNQGIHASRIKGIKASDAEYIIMLDQDDLVKSNWLYSQWNRIKEEKTNYCVCNGWMRRFRVIWTVESDEKKEKINDVKQYLEQGNQIISPGQVIIKKEAIPKEWLHNVQAQNGADDFLLWVMVLKQNEKFSLNEEVLYYHTPDRNLDSIDQRAMNESLKETAEILEKSGVLNKQEIDCLKKQVWQREEKLNSPQNILQIDKEIIEKYLARNHYNKIAIYGMGERGEKLYDLFQNLGLFYVCVDKFAIDYKEEVQIFRPETEFPQVDCMIVCVLNKDKELAKQLEQKFDYPVIALSEIYES